jgi:hypothetical protein
MIPVCRSAGFHDLLLPLVQRWRTGQTGSSAGNNSFYWKKVLISVSLRRGPGGAFFVFDVEFVCKSDFEYIPQILYMLIAFLKSPISHLYILFNDINSSIFKHIGFLYKMVVIHLIQ